MINAISVSIDAGITDLKAVSTVAIGVWYKGNRTQILRGDGIGTITIICNIGTG